MVVVDSSALIAILLGESDAYRMERALFEHKGDLAITAANHLECLMVIEARTPGRGADDLRTLIDVYEISIEPVTLRLSELAFEAWMQFGRGRHSAALNFGDCFSYALAKWLDALLLFKGDDLSLTDIGSVL